MCGLIAGVAIVLGVQHVQQKSDDHETMQLWHELLEEHVTSKGRITNKCTSLVRTCTSSTDFAFLHWTDITEIKAGEEITARTFAALVHRNQPAVLRGAARQWPAFQVWQSNDAMLEHYGDVSINADVAPNRFDGSVVSEGARGH